ncbi:MAG: hypothetical protein ACT4PL_03050 [Phycisphaerales bacterium]
MTHERRQRAFVVFTVSASCFGLLLWARLLLVTNHPRTALAIPTPEESGYPLPRPIPRLPVPPKQAVPDHAADSSLDPAAAPPGPQAPWEVPAPLPEGQEPR